MPKRNQEGLERGFVHPLALVAIFVLVGLVGSANIITTKEFPRSLSAPQNVLGEDEEAKKAEEQAKEAAKKTQEQQKEAQKVLEESQKKQEEQKKEEQKTKTESVSPTGVKYKTQTEGKKSETEVETSDGQKIKTKVEDNGKTKVEIEQGSLKIKYVVENGQIKLKAENEQGEEVELEDDELDEVENEIEDGLEEDGIRIATGSGKPVFTKNNIAALTDFPLSVDVGTNQLIVTTPAGQKVVTILPDQAVANLLLTKVINRVEQSTDASLVNELGTLDGIVKLEIRNNEVVYKVKGTKTHKIFGMFPVNTATTAFVSAETGQSVAQEQSVLSNIIDVLSP